MLNICRGFLELNKIAGMSSLGFTEGNFRKTYIYIYIYIYCHLQTDCFVVSQLFSVARHVGRLKLGSKPTQLYVRLSIVIYKALCFEVAQGRMNGARNETQTHSCRFASLAC